MQQVLVSTTPLERMRRREIVARLTAHGVDFDSTLPKNVLLAIASAHDINLLAAVGPQPEPEAEEIQPELVIADLDIHQLRALARERHGMEQKQVISMKKTELRALLDG